MDELDALLADMASGKVGRNVVARQVADQGAEFTLQHQSTDQVVSSVQEHQRTRATGPQSYYFRQCPHCGSADVATNQLRGYSRCERCQYTVDPSHRPSAKVQQQQQQMAQNIPYTGTDALPQLMQTRVKDNQAVLEKSTEGTNWELFHACQNNDIKKIKMILDLGVDVNVRDTDTGSTPLHWACSKSQQHAIRYLVERGANVNAQNRRGLVPLHSLILNRVEPLAFYLIKKGADINITNNEGHAPVDLALPWTQREMEELYARVKMGKLEELEQKKQQDLQQRNMLSGGGQQQQVYQARAAPVENPGEVKEAMKIFLKSDAYKTLVLTSKTTAGEVAQLMAEKLNLGVEFSRYFDVVERVKKGEQYLERKLDAGANLFDLRAKWPLIFGPSGNETQLYCRFIINIKPGTPGNLQAKFREAAFGG